MPSEARKLYLNWLESNTDGAHPCVYPNFANAIQAGKVTFAEFMDFPKVCNEIRNVARVKIVPYEVASDIVKYLFNVALNNFPRVSSKTIGIMTIERDDNSKVYILSISGSKSLPNGNITFHQQNIIKSSSQWINTIKKEKKYKSLNVHIAPCYDYGDYLHTGIPSLDKVAYVDRKKAQSAQERFWNDLIKEYKKGDFPYKRYADQLKCDEEILKILLMHFVNHGYDENLLVDGVPANSVAKFVRILIKLLGSNDVGLQHAEALELAWNDRASTIPSQVVQFMTDDPSFGDCFNSFANLMFNQLGDMSFDEDLVELCSILYPNDCSPIKPSFIIDPLLKYITCLLFTITQCWNTTGLDSLCVGHRFLHCAEDNCLQYVRHSNLFIGSKNISWTSANKIEGANSLENKDLCEFCRIHFIPVVFCTCLAT